MTAAILEGWAEWVADEARAIAEAGIAPEEAGRIFNSAWAGGIVADVLGLDAASDRKRIKKMIEAWLKSGAFVKGEKQGPSRKPVPTVEVGEWATV